MAADHWMELAVQRRTRRYEPYVLVVHKIFALNRSYLLSRLIEATRIFVHFFSQRCFWIISFQQGILNISQEVIHQGRLKVSYWKKQRSFICATQIFVPEDFQ